jgi:hypothetical protein
MGRTARGSWRAARERHPFTSLNVNIDPTVKSGRAKKKAARHRWRAAEFGRRDHRLFKSYPDGIFGRIGDFPTKR